MIQRTVLHTVDSQRCDGWCLHRLQQGRMMTQVTVTKDIKNETLSVTRNIVDFKFHTVSQ